MKAKRQAAPVFQKVSDWIAAGNMNPGFYLLERIKDESDKAISFQAERFNDYGNLKPATCWIPKSKVQKVENDYYTAPGSPAVMYLVPAWL
jgi:hypothetical protein